MRSVVDFAAGGATRGLLDPPRHPDGVVLQARPARPGHFPALRRELGWSIERTAEAMGVSVRTVWRWQQGGVMPGPAARLLRLLVHLRRLSDGAPRT